MNKALEVANMKPANLVFCYGTLKQGHGNHNHFLQNSLYCGSHTTGRNHSMVNLGAYPGVIYGEGNTAIKGEVYGVSDRVLDRLDGLEGYPEFYSRQEIVTPYGKAFMYTLSDNFLKRLSKDQRPLVDTGEW